MIYRLSYYVAAYPTMVEKFADGEIELAHILLNMERDVGIICHGVTIDEVDRPKDYRRQDKMTCLKQIQAYAKALEKATWF